MSVPATERNGAEFVGVIQKKRSCDEGENVKKDTLKLI
jgi:hypothetical protein